MSDAQGAPKLGDDVPTPSIKATTAVILTHMRPTLARDLTRSLIDIEGLAPKDIVVVVNGVGGLDDEALEASVRMVRLPENLGPAGGFLIGMQKAFSDPHVQWAYLCEDDIGLLPLPSPRLAGLLDRIESYEGEHGAGKVGAVVAFGRSFMGRGSHTVNTVPAGNPAHALAPADVGSWGATVVSRAVYDAGILPDTTWYFGLEDFDWYCRVSEGGFEVLVDVEAARKVAPQQSTVGRQNALRARRPTDVDESWRAYYHARNSFAMARRHGNPGWHLWHLAYSARKVQSAQSNAERKAIAHGFYDGIRGRMGEHPRYGRRVGELPSTPDPEGDEA
jgi:GT2 family glycosyltransferase